jgi:integrase
VRNDYLAENPAAQEEVRRRVPTPSTSRDSLRPGEVNRIVRAVEKDLDERSRLSHRSYIIDVVHFLAATGLRRSELKHLRLVDCTLDENGESGHIVVRPWENPETGESFDTKSGERRRVPLFPRAAQALKNQAGARLEKSQSRPYESAFLAARGGRINMNHFSQYLKDYAEEALPGRGVTPHWFRHTFISWAVNELGITPRKVQRIVGHQSIETTMEYMHTSSGAISGVIDDVLSRHGLGSRGMAMQTQEVIEYLFCQPVEEMEKVPGEAAGQVENIV